MLIYKLIKLLPGKAAIFLFLFAPSLLYAQMFSVEETERRTRPSTTAISVGFDFIDMNETSGEFGTAYNWSEPVYRIQVDMPGIEAYAGFRNSIGDESANADTLNYLNIGANVSGGTPLAGNERVGLMLPIRLSTEYIRVRSASAQQPETDQFRKSSVSIGIGAGGYLNFLSRVRLRAEVVPQIGFTVASLGSDAGQLASVNSKLRLHVDQLIGRFGIVLGHDYSFRRYTGGSNTLNHDLSSNHFTVGINF